MHYLTSGNIGDIIYAIPCILSLSERYDSRAKLYLRTGQKAEYYAGRRHPLGNLRMDEAFARALIPLLRSQAIFDEVDLYTDQTIDLDLDLMRATGIDYRCGHIPRWYFYAFNAHYDLSQPWLWVDQDPQYQNKFVVSRSNGYQNHKLNYKFLDEYRPLFLGLPEEFRLFKKDCPNAEYVITTDFLQIARILNSCKLYVGNQSAIFAVAEGLKIRRVLETCLFAPNVIPHGPNGYDVVNQIAFETTVKDLFARES